MIRYFLKNFAFLLLLNVLIKPIWVFFIDIPVQNAVGHDVYGMYYTAFNFAFIFSIVSDMGLNHFNNIHLADKSLKNEFSYASVLPAKLVFSLLYILLSVLVSLLVFDNQKIIFFVWLTSIFHALTGLILFLRTYLSSDMRFKNDSFFSVFDKILSTLILGTFLYFFHLKSITIETFIYIQILSLLISIFVLVLVLKKYLNFTIAKGPLNTSWIRDAFPYTLLIFVMGIYTRIDSTFLQVMLEGSYPGIYAASYRLIDFLSQYGYLSSVILLPLFSRLKEEKTNSVKLLQSITTVMIFSGFLIAFVFLVFSKEIIQFLYKEDTHMITTVFQIHLMAYPFIISNFVLGSFLTSNKQITFLIRISLIAATFQLLGNYFLIKVYKITGASVGMVLTNIFIFLAQFFQINRISHFENSIRKLILGFIIFGLGIILSFYFNSLGFKVLMLVFVFGGGMWMYALRSELLKHVKEKPLIRCKH